VTVIFLPLSAVASIFPTGGHWAYWAAAVPVTAVVMFLGLLLTGELEKFVAWVASLVLRKLESPAIPNDSRNDELDVYGGPAYPAPRPELIRRRESLGDADFV
jgi:hypothetical protein